MQLSGVRVLDLTRLLPGPYASQLLADAGADVIKIEDTEMGDYARYYEPATNRGVSTIFDNVNRGKRSVALDLKSDAGREAFYRLVEEADVVFEQFRPGVVERLGVDYETVKEYNDDIVYCALSGYGQNGPYANRAGHDLNYVGVAGLLDLTRADEEMAPQIPGYQIGDLGGGLFAAFSIVGALLARELGNTGGEYIDIAMTDVVASFSQTIAYNALTGDNPRPGETRLTGREPWYDVYECADGQYITLAALEPKFWRAFCEEVGCQNLIDYHLTDDPATREAVREELTELFVNKTREGWIDDLSDETMTAPVLRFEETVEHPQIKERGFVERSTDTAPRIGFPARTTEYPDPVSAIPDHGEHTDELLREVGYDDEQLSEIREYGAIV